MTDILVELSLKEVLTNRNASSIKGYISNKYGGLSHQKRAAIFADAVNRIVDRKLPKLPEEQRKHLKEQLFRSVVGKSSFSIDYSDIFTASLEMKTLGNRFFKGLVPWLEEALGRELPNERVFAFVMQSRRKMEEFPGWNIREIVRTVEREFGSLMPADGLSADGLSAAALASNPVPEPTMREFFPAEFVCVPESLPAQPSGTLPGPSRKRSSLLGGRLRSLGRVVLAAGFSGVLLSSLISITNAKDNVAAVTEVASGPVAGTVSEYEPSMIYLPLQRPVNGTPMKMRATAYDLSVESCGKKPGHPAYGITFTGTRAKAGWTVAVDPQVIPLGSRLYIKFPREYGHMDGVYCAEDTGKLIQGEHIDIFFGEDKAGSREVYRSAMKFGVQNVEVTVLDQP